MNDSLVTTDTILDYFKDCVEKKIPIGPYLWVEGAIKLNVLISDEHAKLYDLQQKVAQEKANYIALGNTVSKAKTLVEAMDINKQANLQKAKIGQIEEHIKLSKYMARRTEEEMRGGQ